MAIINFILFLAFSYADVPITPDPTLTPGHLCDTPTEFRYKEKISYCERNVSVETKQIIFQNYAIKYDFTVTNKNRVDFKIDHFIPLCMGGSNEMINLWPQHRQVFEITDPVEFAACEKLSQGLLDQKTAIGFIKKAKLDLDSAPDVLHAINQM